MVSCLTLHLQPSDTATPLDPEQLVLCGEDLLTARRLPEAIAALHRAEAAGADPDRCAGARWHCWMLLGEMELAWRESDAIRTRGVAHAHGLWDGSDPAGKRVVVRSLHGFGDAVQNLRFLPALQRLANSMTLEIAPELLGLGKLVDGVDEVITWGRDAPAKPPAYDVQIEITELPYLLRCETRDLGTNVPYLHLPQTLVDLHRAQHPASGKPRVGLVWTSSQWDPSRSIGFDLFRDLLRCQEVEFWSFQTSPDNTEWHGLSRDRGWPLRAAAEGSVIETALHLAQMDLVLSVDTFVAHLAGALGRPVWLLLKHDADWRWRVDRRDSPWYPTMRLFRQARTGEWQPVLAEVRHCLDRWCAQEESSHASLG